jgi:hypothetical protein
MIGLCTESIIFNELQKNLFLLYRVTQKIRFKIQYIVTKEFNHSLICVNICTAAKMARTKQQPASDTFLMNV